MRTTRVFLLLLGLSTASLSARADDRTEAKKHFQAGVALIKAEDFAAAAAAFETSVGLYSTKTGLFNLANCYKALQRYGEALDTVRRLEREFAGKLGAELEAEVREFEDTIENLVGRLAVDARPAGAAIAVDGRPAGNSPLGEDLLLGPGEHTVEVSLEGFGTERRTVRVESRGKVALSVTLEKEKGQIRISSDVQGARVLLDGVEVGRTPLESPLAASPGRHAVRLVLPGYDLLEREVEVEAGQKAALFLSMKKTGGDGPAVAPGVPAAVPETPPGPRPEDAPPPGRETGISPGWFWGMLAATAVLGGATIGVDAAVGEANHDVPDGAEKDRLERMQAGGVVLLVATGAVAVITAVLGFSVDWGGEDGEEDGVTLAPAAGAAGAGAGIGLEGRF